MNEIDEESNSSPVPEDVPTEIKICKLLNFDEAMSRVVNANKVTKEEWGSEEYYGQLVDGRLQLHKPDGRFYDWIISEGDLEGEDYYVIS